MAQVCARSRFPGGTSHTGSCRGVAPVTASRLLQRVMTDAEPDRDRGGEQHRAGSADPERSERDDGDQVQREEVQLEGAAHAIGIPVCVHAVHRDRGPGKAADHVHVLSGGRALVQINQKNE